MTSEERARHGWNFLAESYDRAAADAAAVVAMLKHGPTADHYRERLDLCRRKGRECRAKFEASHRGED